MAHLPQHDLEEISVTSLYVGLLGLTPETGGYAHWTAEEVGTAALVGLA